MYTDVVADLLTRIRNAGKAHHEQINAPHSKFKESILKVMKERGFIEDYVVEGEGVKTELVVTLKEALSDLTLKKISKPGQRIYLKKEELRPVKNGLGILILSTSKGVMSNTEAYKQNLGGEIICEIS